MIAGDDTGDTNFIMFGRWVQHLTKKSADILIAENPQDFIPNEITRLLEKTFKWNISFTQNTISNSKVYFQVNAILGEINDTNSTIPVTTTSQSSSLMISQGAGNSIQRTPQKSAAFNIPEPQLTPQSRKYPDDDQITPRKEAGEPTEATKPIDEPLTQTEAPHGNDDTIVTKSNANPSESKDVAADSSTKNQKSVSRKMSRSSPNKKIARKLLLEEDTENEDVGCVDDTAKPSSSADA